MKSKTSTFPLRLPVSLKGEVERLSERDGTSINNFVVMAVAQKISAMETTAFLEERAKRANLPEFRKLLDRMGKEAPRKGDEILD